MEIQFRNEPCRTLRRSAWDTKNSEQTLELRVPEHLPKVGTVLATYGQPLIRGKEWNQDHVNISGGVICRVLYVPEDGGAPQSVEGWLPFQTRFELRDSEQDGTVIVNGRIRSVDARLTGAGKLLIRAAVSLQAEALESTKCAAYHPGELPEDVQVLSRDYPVCIPVEAGEKALMLDEDLILPPGKVDAQEILAFHMEPVITDVKLMGDKLVFRGTAKLHVLYLGVDGRIHTYDSEVPISQYTQLENEYGADAQPRLEPMVTELEVEKGEDGRLRLKGSLVGQYVICDQPVIPVVEDAYSNIRSVSLHREELSLPVVLESREETLDIACKLEAEATKVVDCNLFAAQPRIGRTEEGVAVRCEGTAQLLYYDADGKLQSMSERWEQELALPADNGTEILASIRLEPTAAVTPGAGETTAFGQMEIYLRTTGGQGLETVSGLTLGDAEEPDPSRPSLILRRAGDLTLWEMAKKCGSTVDAIRSANNLEDEPEKGQMLLIPVS